MINCTPIYINESQSERQGVAVGWHAMDEHNNLLFGPFSNKESCLRRINRSLNWSISFALRRPLSGSAFPIR
jgi:hypothetical protein